MRGWVAIIWGILAAFFFVMAFRELARARKGISVPSINLGFIDLNQAYETLREGIVDADKSSHRIASVSFVLAGLTALASLILSLID